MYDVNQLQDKNLKDQKQREGVSVFGAVRNLLIQM